VKEFGLRVQYEKKALSMIRIDSLWGISDDTRRVFKYRYIKYILYNNIKY